MSMEKKEYPIDPQALHRIEVCKQCPLYTTNDSADNPVCKMIGTFIKFIVNIEKASCPAGKW